MVSLMVGTTVGKFDCSQGAGGATTPGYDATTAMFNNVTDSPEDKAAENACKLGIATAVTFLSGGIQVSEHFLAYFFLFLLFFF